MLAAAMVHETPMMHCAAMPQTVRLTPYAPRTLASVLRVVSACMPPYVTASVCRVASTMPMATLVAMSTVVVLEMVLV